MKNESPNVQDKWDKFLTQQGKSNHTVTAYQRGLAHFVDWCERAYDAPFEPQRVMPRDIRDWKSNQQSVEKSAPNTINQRLAAVTSFFQWAVTQNLCPTDPTHGIKSINIQQNRPKALSESDMRKLLRAAYGHPRDFAIIELMLGTGIRVGELLDLQIGDFEINERSGKVIVREGKHGGYREIPLTLDVRTALSAYLETHPTPDELAAPIWRGKKGVLRNRSSIMRLLDKYSRLANIETVNPHALRHTFATRYLRANVGDLRGLARLLGHADLNTVMIYTEPNMNDLSRRMENMET